MPGRVVLKRCSRKFRKIHRKTPVLGLFINKFAGLRLATLFKKRLLRWSFPVNFSKFLITPFFTEHPRSTASVKVFNDSSYRKIAKILDRWFRSSHPEVFLGKGVQKICSKFAGEHPWRSAISSIFIKIALRHGRSPVNLMHIFRTPFPKSTSVRLLLMIVGDWWLGRMSDRQRNRRNPDIS